jgi:hypothetical protein
VTVVRLADVVQLVTRLVSENAAIQTIVPAAECIHSAHVQDGDVGSVAYPLVVITPTGGGFLRYQGAVLSQPFEVYAYSRVSQSEAIRLYDACVLALQAQQLIDSTVLASGARNIPFTGYTREVERGDIGFNAKAQAWFARGRFLVQGAG